MRKEPLASILRPKSLGDFVGQEHLVSIGKPLRQAIEEKVKMSFILWGPAGSGKTTLARIYANSLGIDFYELSAVSAGKADIRAILNKEGDKILFLDEIHRFNKAQQDFLLPVVEEGKIILIGATTENPSFEVISPLLSRMRVFILNPLSDDEIEKIILRTGLSLKKDDLEWLKNYSGGDARRVINILEATNDIYSQITKDNLIKTLGSERILNYDKKGDEHYETISAFIKSMRAGQPSSALYYLARMISAGEDPKFIARRMVIFASEDIGMSQPTALVVANDVFRAVETVGLPEAGLNLAHGVVYLATAKKDRRVYDAWQEVKEDVRRFGNLAIPAKIKNPTTDLLKEKGYGKDYEMYDQGDYLPDKLKGKKYFKKSSD